MTGKGEQLFPGLSIGAETADLHLGAACLILGACRPHSLTQASLKTSGGPKVPFSVACGDFGKRREDRTFALQGDIT